jgi:hypothetical protein
MAKAYYGDKISANMTKTPEGFLICHNVPISRTGEYKYLAHEIGMTGDQVISVYREPDEVFSQKTIASFEGKAFTDTHPSQDVTTDTWALYAKGEISNVHRGTGEFNDCLVADLIVRDAITINEIESGVKREVSAGYECDYVKKNGVVYQSSIIGNHVALVQAGRAGNKVKIKDGAEELNKSMVKISQKMLDNAIRTLDTPNREKEGFDITEVEIGADYFIVKGYDLLNKEKVNERFKKAELQSVLRDPWMNWKNNTKEKLQKAFK